MQIAIQMQFNHPTKKVYAYMELGLLHKYVFVLKYVL